jgi:hypothetical protein
VPVLAASQTMSPLDGITKTGSAFAAVRALAPFLAAPWAHRSVLPAIFDWSRLRLL